MSARARAVLRTVHLWLGLSVGLLFAVLGLSGSALVFYVEIDALLHPEVRTAAPVPERGWDSPEWDRALATVHAAWPHGPGEWRFEATDAVGTIPARYSGTGGHHDHRLMVWLSPDGTRVLRSDHWGDYLMTWIYDLHMDLLAGDAGAQVEGWAGIAMLVLLASGVAAWWPRGSWRKALAFKRRAVPLRRLHDLHKLAGLASLPLLLLLVGTGVLLALPAERDLVLAQGLGPLDKPPRLQPQAAAGPPLPLAAILAAGHRALPEARLVWIEVPGDPAAAIRLRVQVPGDPSRRFPRSYIHIDRHSGRVLAVVDYRRAGAATTLNTWLHPLHDASIGGLATRIVALVAGLIPAALFVTGLLHWRRRRARAHRSSIHTMIQQGT